MDSKKTAYVAIVGRANVGKSSLFNVMVGRREAIVADEPGTTRDRVMAEARYGATNFWLIDTAGMKNPQDDFELSIQDQILESAELANLILVITSAEVAPTEEDRRAAKLALKSKRPVILLVNKIDKAKKSDVSQWQKLGIKNIFPVSATQKIGLEEVLSYIAKQLPEAKSPTRHTAVRIGILGRPNVGKSSLFNSLAAKQQALVASHAGTTRDINRLRINYHSKTIEIMDTAGIRRPGKITPGVEKFSVIRALSAIEESDICLLVMDASELAVQMDQKIASLIAEAGKGLVLIVSKWDTIDNVDGRTRARISSQITADFAFVPWTPLVFTSALQGLNVAKILELAVEISETRRQKLSTPELNHWLSSATLNHPPAGLRGRTPSLNYMVQETDQPLPSFKIFGKNLKFLHWSYRRYLEKSLRTQWPFVGTPLKFWFIEK